MKITHRNKDLSDPELVEKYRESGDIQLLGILYHRYMSLVYGVSLKYFEDRDRSQDAVMEIFEILVDKLRQHEVQNFKSWLHVTTRNHCLMQLRKKNPEIKLEDSSYQLMEYTSEEHPDSEGSLEDNLVRLEKCISKLKEDQRKCVELFFLKKKSYLEIEEMTSHTLKKVKSFIQNGKRNLKICMESDE